MNPPPTHTPADAGATEAEIDLIHKIRFTTAKPIEDRKTQVAALRSHVASCLAEKEAELVAIGAQVGHQPIYSWPVGTTVARRLASLEAELAKLKSSARLLVDTIKAHEVTCFSCDRDGETYCDCIKKPLAETENLLK